MYYTYIVVSDSEPRYVGKGSKERWRHAVGGASTCRNLNKDYFDGKHLEVYIHSVHEKSEEALETESFLIDYLNKMGYNLYNQKITDKYQKKFTKVPSIRLLGCNCKDKSCVGSWNPKMINVLIGEETQEHRFLQKQRRLYITKEFFMNPDLDRFSQYVEQSLLTP